MAGRDVCRDESVDLVDTSQPEIDPATIYLLGEFIAPSYARKLYKFGGLNEFQVRVYDSGQKVPATVKNHDDIEAMKIYDLKRMSASEIIDMSTLNYRHF